MWWHWKKKKKKSSTNWCPNSLPFAPTPCCTNTNNHNQNLYVIGRMSYGNKILKFPYQWQCKVSVPSLSCQNIIYNKKPRQNLPRWWSRNLYNHSKFSSNVVNGHQSRVKWRVLKVWGERWLHKSFRGIPSLTRSSHHNFNSWTMKQHTRSYSSCAITTKQNFFGLNGNEKW